MPVALSADRGDQNGRAFGRNCARVGFRHRFGIEAPTRYFNCGWAADLSGSNALHDTGDLPLYGPGEQMVRALEDQGEHPGKAGCRGRGDVNVSQPFVRRPIATSLLAAAVLLSGAVAYRMLPIAPLPRVDFPALAVSAGLPGATPETLASAVATPLERRFGRIAGVNEITAARTLGA